MANGKQLAWGLISTMGLLAPLAAHGCSSDETGGGSSSTTSSGSGGSAGGVGLAGGTGGAGGGTGGSGGGTGGSAGGLPPNGADCSPPVGSAGQIQLTEIITGLTNPVLVTAPWGDAERLFVLEQGGVIKLWRAGTLSDFLDIDPVVQSGGERGLLGLAFHPDYTSNGRFFVHYSDNNGDTTIEEYARSANDPDVADPAPVGAVYMSVSQPHGNHNGGSIEFSPVDGLLYIGLGDGGSGGDPDGNGQNKTTLLAALLRIDVASNPYGVPAGNITDGAPEIYDWGLRNPYRFSFDVCTGDRYIGDVGQNAWEEIDVAAAGDGNKNWGWNTMEGAHCYSPPNGCDMTGLDLPAVEYVNGQDGCSVTGGHVYRGSAIPWLRGAYLYGDYCSGRIWMFRWQSGQITDEAELLSTGLAISAFGQGNDGELYVVDYGGNGGVYRIDPL